MIVNAIRQYNRDLDPFHKKCDGANMINYIRDFKHLVGCEFVVMCGKQKGRYISEVLTDANGCFDHIVCNAGYTYGFKNITVFYFYLNDDVDRPSGYFDYMNYHYPEYNFVWKHQLC